MRSIWYMTSFLLLVGLGSAAGEGFYVEGYQEASYLISNRRGTDFIKEYSINGFHQSVERLSEEVCRVSIRIDLDPLPALAAAPCDGPCPKGVGREERRDVTTGITRRLLESSKSRYEAIHRILRWIRENIAYEVGLTEGNLDKIIRSRKANCIGFSKLAERMLEEICVDTRQVHGLLIRDDTEQRGKREIELSSRVLHRWIELSLEGGGRFFADPLSSFYFVDGRHIFIEVDREGIAYEAERFKGTTIIPLSYVDKSVVIETFSHRAGTVFSRKSSEKARTLPVSLGRSLKGGGRSEPARITGTIR